MKIDTEKWTTVAKAHKIFGVARTTIHHWLRTEKVRRITIGGHPFYNIEDLKKAQIKKRKKDKRKHV
jgi:DNA-binding transcriptional MerR regulator